MVKWLECLTLVREDRGSNPENGGFFTTWESCLSTELVLDGGAGRRKGALAVYTPLGRACTAECCVCNIHAPLRNST
jgi:hypothetical protein